MEFSKVKYFWSTLMQKSLISDKQFYELGTYRYLKFRWAVWSNTGVPRKMLIHYFAHLNFKYL